MNPWKGIPVKVAEQSTAKQVAFKMDNSNGECIVFQSKKGLAYLVQKK